MPLPRALARRSAVPRRRPRPPSLRRAPSPAAPTASRVRRTLRASAVEGVLAEVVAAATGTAALTAWAIHLGCGPGTIALAGALPFVAHVLQLPASWLTARHGARRVALAAIVVSRQAYLPLVALPFLDAGPAVARAVLVGAAVAHHGLGVVCNNAWVAWMGEVVPRRIRGRWFGRRTAACTLAAALSAVAVGVALDRSPAGRTATLSGVAALASVAGAASAIVMARQHGGARARRALRPWPALGAALRARSPRRWASLQAVCGLASGLGVPFLALLVVRDLGLGFAFLAAHGAVAAVARTASAPAWGRWVDRPGGARAVVIAANAVAIASPVLWIASARGGPALLLADAALGGIAAAGSGVAGMVFPLTLSDDASRPAYHAVFSVAGGLAFGVGAALGAALAGAAPSVAGPLTVPFALCAALRVAAVALSIRLRDAEPPAPVR